MIFQISPKLSVARDLPQTYRQIVKFWYKIKYSFLPWGSCSGKELLRRL